MSKWAFNSINMLVEGKSVIIKPIGNSMSKYIKSGERIKLDPVEVSTLTVGDIVLCEVNGSHYLHLIKAIGARGFLIGNCHGRVNGWTKKIYGKYVGKEQ